MGTGKGTGSRLISFLILSFEIDFGGFFYFRWNFDLNTTHPELNLGPEFFLWYLAGAVTLRKGFLLLPLLIFMRNLFSSDKLFIQYASSSPNKNLEGLGSESNSLIKGTNSGERLPLSQCLRKLDNPLNAEPKRTMDCCIQCKSSPMVISSFSSLIFCQMLMIGVAAAVKND